MMVWGNFIINFWFIFLYAFFIVIIGVSLIFLFSHHWRLAIPRHSNIILSDFRVNHLLDCTLLPFSVCYHIYFIIFVVFVVFIFFIRVVAILRNFMKNIVWTYDQLSIIQIIIPDTILQNRILWIMCQNWNLYYVVVFEYYKADFYSHFQDILFYPKVHRYHRYIYLEFYHDLLSVSPFFMRIFVILLEISTNSVGSTW